jgi:hypothetical protein
MHAEKVYQRLCTVECCQKPHYSGGLCQMHKWRLGHYGDVNGARFPQVRLSFSDPLRIQEYLLQNRTVDEHGCWLWNKYRNGQGYGTQYVDGKPIRLNRLAAHLWLHFDLTSDLDVLHECDNPPCFNPNHLRPGTRLENMADMARKGRGRRKLQEEEVVFIRQLLARGNSQASIARQFGVTRTAIEAIAINRTWKHVG